jgi:hypothetical protein
MVFTFSWISTCVNPLQLYPYEGVINPSSNAISAPNGLKVEQSQGLCRPSFSYVLLLMTSRF